MKLKRDQLTELCNYAISASLQAGKALRNYEIDDLDIYEKKKAQSLAGSVVTEADFKSQEIIVKTLDPTLRKYDLALLSEEEPDDKSRFEKNYFWCIDPLDGTLPFSRGQDGYAISIALVSNSGEAIIGVAYHPPSNTLWHAIKGLGACRNHTPISLPWKGEHQITQYFIDRSFLTDPHFAPTVKFLKEQSEGKQMVSVDHVGGAVIQALAALNYASGAYFKFPRLGERGGSIWDYAATNCIYQELNMMATDLFGNAMDLNRSESTFMNHRGILFTTTSEMANIIQRLYDEYQQRRLST